MAAACRCGRHASHSERLQHWGTYFAQFSTHRLVGTTACNPRPQPAGLQLLGYFAKAATHTYKATCIEQSCAAAGAKHAAQAQRVSVSTDTSTAAGDNAARLESPSPRPSPGPTDSPAPVLVVDGTNLLMQCRADRGWGVSHAEAFEAWLQSLQRLTRAGPTYVVFDNKRGKAAGGRGGPGRGSATAAAAAAGAGLAVAVQEERRALVPGYLDKRHAKGGCGGSQSGPQGGTGGAAAAEQKRSDIPPVGISSASRHEPLPQSRPGPGAGPAAAAAAGAHSSPGPPQPRHPRLPEVECLMDMPPSHLAPFVAAIRRAGGLALYGIPGLEADDLIASLTAGLLTLPPPPQQQPGLAAGQQLQQQQQQQQQQQEGQQQQRQEQQQGAQAGPATAALAAPPPLRVLVASGDADMLQLLALPGVAWLELRQLSRAASAQEPPPLAVSVSPALVAFGHTQSPTLGVMGAAAVGPGSELLRLHQAASSSLGAGTEPVGSAASGSAPQQLLPPAAYPDLLALVGKPEAGVVGAGVSAKSARKLLLRYGSVEGLARAYDEGELDDALRLTPLGNARASACVRAGQAAAPGEGPATMTSATPSGAGGGSGGGGGSGCKEGGARQSQAVQRALRNVRVTRMRTDLSTVPWGRVQGYQQERQQQRVEQDSGQAPTAPLGPSALAALPLSLPLHPHDAMHAASAAPYVAALAAALAARGLACRVSHMGPRGGLVDLSLTLSVQPSGLAAEPGAAAAVVGGGEGRGESSGVGRMAAAGASGAAGARALQGVGLGSVSAAAVEYVASELARLAGSTAGAAGAGIVTDDGDGGRNSAGSRDTGVSGRAASGPGAGVAPGCLGPLNPGFAQALTYVCVLSPWDFDADAPALHKARGGVGKGGNGSGNGSTNGSAARSGNGSNSGGSDTKSEPQAPAASAAASSEACSRTDPHARLAALASSLRRAAGPRQSLCNTPNALRALLRPTSAWRLKSLQRVLAGGGNAGAGGDVLKPSDQGAGRANVLAVVPFYELLQAEVTGPDSVLI